MKKLSSLLIGFSIGLALSASAAVFTSDMAIPAGNTNFDGDDIEVIGCTVTIDGPHTFSDVFVLANGAIVHSPATNSADIGLDLTISNYLVIEAGSGIVADGLGYSAGDGPGAGNSATNTIPFGLTLVSGGGGGHGGNGSASIGGASGGAAYDSLLTPANAGSGGGAGTGPGGAGGGIVKLTIGGALILDGRISADGGPGSNEASGGGAGGSISLISPMASGAGIISANGGAGESSDGGGGAGGRVMVAFTNDDFAGSITAQGGEGAMAGGAGTIFSPGIELTNPMLLIDNGGLSGTNTPVNAPSTANVTVRGGAIASFIGFMSVNKTLVSILNLKIESNSWVTVLPGKSLSLSATSVSVDAGGGFNFNGEIPTTGLGIGQVSMFEEVVYGGGGGHGGLGGNGYEAKGGITFDSINQPSMVGGTGAETGGAGGNALEIKTVQPITLNGVITVDGAPGARENSGGGAGGSIYVIAPILYGNGTISANGGNARSPDGGGGGGGRVALILNTNDFTGAVSAHGGIGYENGGPGTIFVQQTAPIPNQLLLDNGGLDGPPTPISSFQASLILTNDASATLTQTLQSENLYISSNCFLICPNFGSIFAQNLVIESNGGIIGDAVLTNSILPQSGATLTSSTGVTSGGGGAGVGFGGNSALGAAGGNPTLPQVPNVFTAGNGGGKGGGGGGNLQVEVEGTALVNGRISANGGAGNVVGSGGGGGGTLNLTVGSMAGSGVVSANGGSGQFPLGGGGGGGTVNLTINHTNLFAGTMTAYGGDGAVIGGAGAIFLRTNQEVAQLTLDNNGRTGTNTFLTSPLGGLFDLSVINGAVGHISEPLSDCRNLLVGSNAALTLTTNYLSLFELQFLGNVTVQATGIITADGDGYVPISAPTIGQIPGGTGGNHGGSGGSGAGGPVSLASTDAAESPTQPGLGGEYPIGSSPKGGRGGGSLVFTCELLTVDGQISANGQPGISEGCGGGAGGTISIHATAFSGNGSITANGGAGNLPDGGGGGGGRIALQTTTDLFTGTISAAGGPGFNPGGAGTIYTQVGTAQGTVVIDNAGNSNGFTTFPRGGNFNVTLRGNAIAIASFEISFGSLILQSNSFLIANDTFPTTTIQATGNVTIGAGCGISCDAVSAEQTQLGGLSKYLGDGSATGGGGANAGNGGNGEGGATGGTAAYEGVTQAATEGGPGGGLLLVSGPPTLGGGGLSLSVKGILEVDGALTANGADATNEWGGGGAGGSVNISATSIAGTGTISADGGSGNLPNGGGGGGGRVSLSVESNTFTGLISAYGGQGFMAGGAGTVYIATQGLRPQLIIDNGGLLGGATPLWDAFPTTVDLTVTDGAILEPRASLSFEDLLIESNAFISQLTNNFPITVSGNAQIAATAGISADGGGWNADTGPGAGTTASNYTSSGGGYGGAGGSSEGGVAGGQTNGSPEMPIAWGSGGGVLFGQVTNFSQGGGAISLNVAGTLTLSGMISANGNNGVYPGSGGGAGGSILLAAGTLTGNGLIAANGGAGQDASAGGGGGGRIAIYSASNSFDGSITVMGGTGFAPGGIGSIFISTNKTAAEIATTPIPGLEISQPETPALLNLSWIGNTGVSYQVQSSDDLIHWQPYGGVVPCGSGSTKVTLIPNPNSQQQYFRLVIVN